MLRIASSIFGLFSVILPFAQEVWGQTAPYRFPAMVRVEAPFVRVYVGPHGETSVRAPFVAIDTPGRWARRFPQPGGDLRAAPQTGRAPQPQLADPALLGWQALRRMFRSGAFRLDEQLDGMATGGGWQDYLQTKRLRELLPHDIDAPPDAATVEVLRDVLQRFDAAGENPSFRAVTSLSGFGTVHAALRQLTIPPEQRQPRLRADGVEQFEKETLPNESDSSRPFGGSAVEVIPTPPAQPR
ncbi:MAG: hypothetical protein GXY83_00105 [Rhodopirellula sp.]|nr:hypothetical protein [Rhodopirellula sp.]